MDTLNPFEVASLRILSAGIVLTPYAIRAFKQIPSNKLVLVMLSGLIGSFIPAFLFCLAETKLNSSLTGMLNSLTPICAVIIGTIFFGLKVGINKIMGILIGLIGLFFLVSPSGALHFDNPVYILLVILATILYAINVNMVSRKLQGIGSINIASVAFVTLIIPCVFILFLNGYFARSMTEMSFIKSTSAACVLGMVGTAFASVIFYILVKRAGALFSSMVTYGIPFVAVGWGLIYGEPVTLQQIGCLGVILGGVYLANR